LHTFSLPKIRLLLISATLMLLGIFVGFYEKRTEIQDKNVLTQYSELLTKELWSYSYQGAAQSLRIIARAEDYLSISLYTDDGVLFAEANRPKADGWIDPTLTSLGFTRIRSFKSPRIVFNNQELGWLEATKVDRNFSLYIYALITLSLFFSVVYYAVQTNFNRRKLKELTQSLMKRVAELNTSNVKLIEAEQLRGQFIANFSHELRTPLTLILSPMDSLLSGLHGNLSGEQERMLSTVRNNAVRLLQMINGILDFSKLEAGRFEVKRESVDLIKVTESVVADFQTIARQKNIDLRLESVQFPQTVSMDRYLFERILFNLLSNAVKFSKRGGKVSVTLKIHQDDLILSVSDSGIGIKSEDKKHLFKQFHQLEGSSTRRFEGTGLGLALVKEFASLLDGKVTVESQEGKGSTFKVQVRAPRTEGADESSASNAPKTFAHFPVLPFATPPSEKPEIQSPNHPTASEPKLIIAEDNAELAAYLASLLSDFGKVRIARDGDEALSLANEWNPDLMILDLMMPKRDGFQVCKELKTGSVTSKIAVIILSALTHREALLMGWDAGADDYLFKPFHPEEVRVRIRSLIKAQLERKVLEGMRDRAEHELKRSNQELEQYAFVVSHDLQAPLTEVLSLGQSLLSAIESSWDNAPLRLLQSLVHKASRMKALVQNILALSRLESMAPTPRLTDTGKVLEQVIDDCHTSIVNSSATITHTEMPILVTDSLQLGQILQNLIGNALKFKREESPLIHVSSKLQRNGTDTGFWVFSVKDNGKGIDKEYLNDIFLIFNRVDVDTEPGSGIGLATCKKIVERLGGKIWVESEKGLGSTFYFSLPAEQSEKLAPPQVASTQTAHNEKPTDKKSTPSKKIGPPKQKLVVVVDDNSIVRSFWESALPADSLKTFDSPEAFWKSIETGKLRFDEVSCFVTDFFFKNNSVYTGEHFAKELRKATQTPLFLSTDAGEVSSETLAHFEGLLPKGPDGVKILVQWLRQKNL
jgi:signal transduction histidine kinase